MIFIKLVYDGKTFMDIDYCYLYLSLLSLNRGLYRADQNK